jgi:hypothetical protein
MALTDMVVRSLKAKTSPRKYSDGRGLHLLVTPRGSKLWRLAYRFDGKQKTLAPGAYPEITWPKESATQQKKWPADGADPSDQRRQERIAKATAWTMTFGRLPARSKGWSSWI